MHIDLIRELCLALPYTTESVKWENVLVFSVGERMFCMTSLDGELRISVKTGEQMRAQWMEKDGVVPAPYLAKGGWIQVQARAQFRKQELAQLLAHSYHLVFAKLTRRQQKELVDGFQNKDANGL